MTMSSPAFELRCALKTAAAAAYLDGASDDQINSIVALARGSSGYNVGACGRLTRGEADRIIAIMIENGAEPEFRKTADEISAEAEQAAEIAARIAAKKASKAQKRAAKAAREEANRKIDGRRVTHSKFGEGTVIAEDEKSLTVMFDSQKKALRMAREFCV